MNNAKEIVTQQDLATIIVDYVAKTSGLQVSLVQDIELELHQSSDGKRITLKKNDLHEVLVRQDSEGKDFLQINLSSERKILLTDQLVGFKPIPTVGLDISKLPRVVTTVDLVSVFEAIEEAVTQGDGEAKEDAETLKKVFQAILTGAEKVGFDLSSEKTWLKRIPQNVSKTCA